jgi:hypothetical protein
MTNTRISSLQELEDLLDQHVKVNVTVGGYEIVAPANVLFAGAMRVLAKRCFGLGAFYVDRDGDALNNTPIEWLVRFDPTDLAWVITQTPPDRFMQHEIPYFIADEVAPCRDNQYQRVIT